jgi:CubicO group peptidase (beta-lactamase class C family)
MAVMKLVELGKAELDAPVCLYLPRFTMRDKRYKQITLRMCLNHSSGLPGTDMKNAFGAKWLGDGYYDHLYDYFSKSILKAGPGEFSVYCNDGFELAEMAVAEISGMSYPAFINKYIAKPINADSLCAGNNLPDDRVFIAENGKKNEFVTPIGAGGIISDMSDCARFGYIFLEPENIFKPESIAEVVSRQGKSFLPDNLAANMGLGWDQVVYNNETYDFGSEVYLKSGGTFYFLSYLVVIKKYKISAAISTTIDTKIDALSVILDLCAMMLEELGIVTRKAVREAQKTTDMPVPADLAELYSGRYYRSTDIYDVRITNNMLKITQKASDGWITVIENAVYDGSCFHLGSVKFVFQESNGSVYIARKAPHGLSPFSQKLPRGFFPEHNPAWVNRAGKKYVLCDGNPFDILPGKVCGITVLKPEKDEPLIFFMRGSETAVQYLPALTVNDTDTRMFLNAPGGAGSRDCFAPFIRKDNGTEYLYCNGSTFVDAETLMPLQTGRVTSKTAEDNKVYRTEAGKKVTFDSSDTVRLILSDENFAVYYDSSTGDKTPETRAGFAIFLNSAPMDLAVRVL